MVRYRRMPIEIESPEQLGYDTIAYNLSESSVADHRGADRRGADLGWPTPAELRPDLDGLSAAAAAAV